MTEKVCVVCNKKLDGQQEKYCSRRCNRGATRQRHKKPCLDCGKLVHQESARCVSCSRKALRGTANHCLDCGKPIGRKSKRCRSCATKKRWKDPEWRITQSEMSKERWQDPEYIAKVVEGVKAARRRSPYTQETRHKLSEAAKLRFQNPDERYRLSEALKAAWQRGDFDNPKIRENRSRTMKAKWQDPEYRDKMSEIQKASYQNPERRRKTSEASKAMWQDPEYRRRQPGISRAIWQDPNICHKITEGIRASKQNPEAIRRHSEATRAMWERGVFDSDETRLKRSEAAKAQWQNPEIRRKLVKAVSEGVKAAWARGDFNGNSEAMKAAWARGAFDGVFCPPHKTTEVPLMVALDICGIEHVSQYRPDGCRFTYDEFIPPDVLVEADGDYWHGPKKPRVQKRDVKKAVWAKDNGYTLIIMWEHEIQEQGAWALVHERVLPLLKTEER